MSRPKLLLPDSARSLSSAAQCRWGQAYGCAPALVIGEYQASQRKPILVIVPSVVEAESLEAQLNFFCHADCRIGLLPDPETLPYDSFSPHADLISRRMSVLAQLLSGQLDICVVATPTLAYRLPPLDYLERFSLSLTIGQQLDLADLQARLENSGYERVSQVSQHGEYAVRGSLIDLYPVGLEQPVRIDFFDQEVDSLRHFDPDSQLSGAALESLEMLPAREFAVTPDAIREFRNRFRERFEGNPGATLIYSEVSENRFPGGIENYLPLFHETTASVWDYLSDECVVISTEDFSAVATQCWDDIAQRYEQLRHDIERPALKPEELFCSADDHGRYLFSHTHINLLARELPELPDDGPDCNLAATIAPAVMVNTHSSEPAAALFSYLQTHKGRLLIAAESAGRRELLGEILTSHELAASQVSDWQDFLSSNTSLGLTIAPLEHGVSLPDAGITIIAEQELFGSRPQRRKSRRVRDPYAVLNDLTDLNPGTPVVHLDYGVGRYCGLSHLEIDAVPGDFLTIEYAGGDRLHVPVGSLQLISRYTGSAPENAPLHRLGTDQWERAKKKAADQIRDVAVELLDLYASREARTGRSWRVNPLDYERFAAGFPFELTEDQATAIDATLEDLHRTQSMDRLVCGDVGFGKTEVALRAAFVATMGGAQVAILAPTTLLAQQHYQTFIDRFADWPVNIEVLSRFRTAREIRTVLEGLRNGKVDIVIGTHKLLQPGIEFDRLGLVIVDEEHRFGVRQKEQLKKLRTEVDILTLTATPIPRTLNMAMGELRDLSLIATPPESRLSVKTFVTEWKDSLLREACQRELKRGGQVYFVHNRIEDIEKQTRRLKEIMPDAKIRIAHGQMRELELEQIMADFYHRRFHILACTAIIESGLDIPSANTIIINRADRFGLAQLHQLRGRVGRSHHKAFALLLTPPQNTLTADAKKRLTAIEAMEDLGAGFVLATHDLEIRGAGELLGEQQTGQIQQIGFSLYTEMLGQAVDAMRRGETPDIDQTRALGPELNLHLPALLPEDYMPDIQMRLVLYKRIASAPDAASLRELKIELIDRFGLLPLPTVNLFRQTALRLQAASLGIRKIEAWPQGVTVEFSTGGAVDPALLVRLIQEEPECFSLDPRQRLRMQAELIEPDARFAAVEQLLEQLHSGG